MTRTLEPDFLYRLDQMIANRRDGGTVSDTLSEATGIDKTNLHAGMVTGAGVIAAIRATKAIQNPIILALALAAIGASGKALFEYMEAPRRRVRLR